jgi:hypothetical protein
MNITPLAAMAIHHVAIGEIFFRAIAHVYPLIFDKLIKT